MKRWLAALGVLAGLALPARADDIELSLEVRYDFLPRSHHAAGYVQGTGGFGEEISLDAYVSGLGALSEDERIESISGAGARAASTYNSSDDADGVLEYSEIYESMLSGEPSGRCGALDSFVAYLYDRAGFSGASVFNARTQDDIGHYFAVARGEDGWILASYGEFLRTGTFNFLEALRMNDFVTGRAQFNHTVYDPYREFKLFYITPDGHAFYRFSDLRYTARQLEELISERPARQTGIRARVGNVENSLTLEHVLISGDARPSVSLFAKAGSLRGVEHSPLRSSPAFQLGLSLETPRDEGFFFGVSPSVVLLYARERRESSLIPWFSTELYAGSYFDVTDKDSLRFLLHGLVCADMRGLWMAPEEIRSPLLRLTPGLRYAHDFSWGSVGALVSAQFTGVANNPFEQRPAVQLTDLRVGPLILWRPERSVLEVRPFVSMKPEELEWGLACGLEARGVRLDLSYSFGDSCLPVRFADNHNVSVGLRAQLDERLELGASGEWRLELWENDPQVSGSLSASLRARF